MKFLRTFFLSLRFRYNRGNCKSSASIAKYISNFKRVLYFAKIEFLNFFDTYISFFFVKFQTLRQTKHCFETSHFKRRILNVDFR